ncbi:hypothetical protein GJ744_011991 [Endocarpon pusillum]|uniref:Uncharacterized protein n=1 Tax=Endocarpon pusillum TaxID=364733 RepID=A0A8H7APG6_9EURO|nr:hypothetical protein GJ744_011991 [Endocarpon pusillum]
MAERSVHKRRHSTTPSTDSDAAAQVSSPIIKRQRKSMSRRRSPRSETPGNGATGHATAGPSTYGQTIPPQLGQQASRAHLSVLNTSARGQGQTEAQNGYRTATGEEAFTGPSHPSTSYQSTKLPGGGFILPQNHNQPTLQLGEASMTMPGPNLSSFMNEFVFEALELSPSYFPTTRALQRSPKNKHQLLNGVTLLPSGYNARSSTPDTSVTTSVTSTYPAILSTYEVGAGVQQSPAQQFQRSQFSLALPQAYSVPTGVYLQGGVQQAHFTPPNFISVGQPHPPNQGPELRHLSQQSALPLQAGASPETAISSAQAGPPHHQTGDLVPPFRQNAATDYNVLDPSAGYHTQVRYSQQAQPTSASTHIESPSYAAPVFSPYPQPGATHTLLTPAELQQNPLPRQHAPGLQDLTAQQNTAAQQAPHPQRTPPLHPHPDTNLPIDPQLASSSYLWAQLEATQLTMVGILTALLVETRNLNEDRGEDPGEAGGQGFLEGAEGLDIDIDEAQVQAITRNLINVMTLWWLIRKKRGWTT